MTTSTAALANTAHTKITLGKKALCARMIERDEEVNAVVVAMVAGEHCLFVGPPGTGKSMLCDAAAELVDGNRFSYLMTKFTSPEEVFGPISLKGLQNDEYVRITTGKLPEAQIAFLDEIFKSSSAILNSMLKILNERTYDSGRGAVSVPLRLCVAASNEWPNSENGQELGALFDRFVIRRVVKPVQTADGRKRLRFDRTAPAPIPANIRLTPQELDAARTAAANLPWSDEAMQAYEQIVRELNREGIQPGDRRERKAIGVVQAAAWVEGATEVCTEHLEILADVLWDEPSEQPHKTGVIVSRISNPTGHEVNTLMLESAQIMAQVNQTEISSLTASAQKLSEIAKKLRPMKGNAKADKALKDVEQKIRALKTAALDSVG